MKSFSKTTVLISVAPAIFLLSTTYFFYSRWPQMSSISTAESMPCTDPINDFESLVDALRLEHGCRDLDTNDDGQEWPRATISLKDYDPPHFLPEYKNPCWYNGTEDSIMCLPYFYVAGFPKSGTTDLHYRLVRHPLIVEAATKEPHYLGKKMYETLECKELASDPGRTNCLVENYVRKFFPTASQVIRRNRKYLFQSIPDVHSSSGMLIHEIGAVKYSHPIITVDGSASTAWDTTNWRLIKENQGCTEPVFGLSLLVTRLNPEVKIIMILRDPTDRVYSDYVYFNQERDKKPSPEDFHESIITELNLYKSCSDNLPYRNCLISKTKVRPELGFYHEYVSDWLKVLPRSQLLFLHSETYRKNVTGTLADVFAFLDLPPLDQQDLERIASIKEQNTNSKEKHKVGPMLPETETLLRAFYAEHNEKLAQILQDERFLWRQS